MRVSHISITIMIILIHILIQSDLCVGDTNSETGFNCPEGKNDSITTEPTFQPNLQSLLSSLVTNAPLKRGFFKSKTGQDHDKNKLYGLVQCRGDISAVDCAGCTKRAVRSAAENCPRSRDVSVWFRWCFLRYSNSNFLGLMDQTSVSRTNDTDFDDLSVVSKGLELMTGLTLTVQKRALMFEASSVDVGPAGKRFGMAQCNRDIGRDECGKCLQSQLSDFKTTVWNKRGWEVYGLSCSMWYHDYQFYFNFSVDSSQGVARLDSREGVLVQAMVAMLALVIVL